MIWFLYLADVFDNIGAVAGVLGVLGFVYAAVRFLADIFEETAFGPPPKSHILAIFMIICVAVFTPKSKTIWLMMGVSATQQAFDSELGEKVLSALHKQLDVYLAEGVQ